MKILTSAQIRDWDRYTVQHESIPSIELMERAAQACVERLMQQWQSSPFVVFAGHGNNGGDGLAIARLLKEQGSEVRVYHVFEKGLLPDGKRNLERLLQCGVPYSQIKDEEELPGRLPPETIIIDALLGTGQNRPPEGILLKVIQQINLLDCTVVAIDLPTGLYADRALDHDAVIKARYTLSFQVPKLCFFMPEHEAYVGQWELLDIGLSPSFPDTQDTRFLLTETAEIRDIILPRPLFSHKGSHGTALLVAGSHGMMGAAVLAARSCIRSGAGKLYPYIPRCGLDLMQMAVPEAVCHTDPGTNYLEQPPDILEKCTSVGVGPGIGQHPATRSMLSTLLDRTAKLNIPLVLDADALNIIASEGWQERIPEGSVLTPHLTEFARLFGPSDSHYARLERSLEVSHRLGIFILIKGRYSFLSTPNGRGWFNSTGNTALAKAGSGDVLTGILTGILAQKYSTEAGSRLATFLHGMAGELASQEHSEYGVTASDLTEKIGFCYRKVFQI